MVDEDSTVVVSEGAALKVVVDSVVVAQEAAFVAVQ
jgi:hypothetical protein